jgi:hypothetical protein
MNTKLLPKEYTDRKKKIINLHESGLSIQEIKTLTNTHPSVIKRIIERNKSEYKSAYIFEKNLFVEAISKIIVLTCIKSLLSVENSIIYIHINSLYYNNFFCYY